MEYFSKVIWEGIYERLVMGGHRSYLVSDYLSDEETTDKKEAQLQYCSGL